MPFDVYDTHTLLGVVSVLPPPPGSYWLDTYFPNEQRFEQEWIDFDKLAGSRRLAPFVSPLASGKPMLHAGFSTRRFKPAYIKPLMTVDPTRIVKRRPGEALLGSMSLAARRDAVIAEDLQEMRNMIHRRWEWMACEAIVKGSVIVAGDDYPAVTVDFGRDAALTVTLSGTSLWTDTVNSDPIANLETWFQLIWTKTGFAPDRVTMGLTAWAAYRNHPKVQAQANVLLRGTTGEVRIAPMKPGVVQQMGVVGDANVPIFVYNDIYEDDSKVNQPFLDQTYVVITSVGVQGTRCFGAILDPRAGFIPLDIFYKDWMSENPPVEYNMAQSAPLMVPLQPDATFRAKVVT